MIVANGPLGEQSDPSMRGLSIFATDLAEAARLSDGDPSVQAGRLAYDLMEWWVAAGTLAFPKGRRSASAGRCRTTESSWHIRRMGRKYRAPPVRPAGAISTPCTARAGRAA